MGRQSLLRSLAVLPVPAALGVPAHGHVMSVKTYVGSGSYSLGDEEVVDDTSQLVTELGSWTTNAVTGHWAAGYAENDDGASLPTAGIQ